MTTNIINQQQEHMISMVIRGENITTIARELNVTRSTIYAWLNKDFIRNELESRHNELRKAAKDKITGNVCKLVDNLMDLANNASDNRVKLQANKYLLNQCIGIPVASADVSTGNNDNSNDTNIIKEELDNLRTLKLYK